MESVYEQKKYRLLYTKRIDFETYFRKYHEELRSFFNHRKKGEGLRALLDIDDEYEYYNLKQAMDPNKAKNAHIPKAFVPKRRFLETWALYELPSFDPSLRTLQNLKKETREEKYKRLNSSKYFGEIVLEYEKEENDKFKPRNLEALTDYLLCLRIENIVHSKGTKRYSPSQELWIPGRLTLEKIKDRIICQEDYQLANPEVKRPDESNSKRKMDCNKYGMFYINKEFFIDKRWGTEPVHDYSTEVQKWMSSKNIDPGNVKSMHETVLKDLPLRLGYPYLYMHQGKCEHLITFTDARLLQPLDCPFIEDYPILKSFSSRKGRYCVLCQSRLAKLCVLNCDIIPYDNAFVCNTCALSYLYDCNGSKKSNFTLFKYVDRSAII